MKIIKILPVVFFKEDSGSEPVRKWLKTLTIQDRKIIGRDIGIVQTSWPIGSPLVKHLSVGLWEVRSKLDNRIARTIFTMHDGQIVLLHGFIKKTEKTPPSEIQISMVRKKTLNLQGKNEKK